MGPGREVTGKGSVGSGGRQVDISTGLRYCGAAMKTTVELPDALFRQAKIRAAERGQTLRELFIEALEAALYPNGGAGPGPRSGASGGGHFEVDELGIPVLRRLKGDSTTVTTEFVNALRDREGV